MIKNILKLFITFLLLFNNSYSNNRYRLGIGYNNFTYHSINNIEISNRKNLSNSVGLNAGLQRVIRPQLYLDINVNFNYSKSRGYHNIFEYDEYLNLLSYSSISKTNEYYFPIDCNFSSNIMNLLGYGLGLSLVGVNRHSVYKFYRDDVKAGTPDFIENLYIFGIGLNSYIRFSYPLFKSDNILLFNEVRFKYIDKLCAYSKGNDLGNLKYNYLQFSIQIGFEFKKI